MSTKNRILSAASALFADDGYDAATIRKVAASVGIKESSLYNHFSSKRDLFAAVLKFQEGLLSEKLASFRNEPLGSPFTDETSAQVAVAVAGALRIAIFFHTDPTAVTYRRLLRVNLHRDVIFRDKLKRFFQDEPLSLIASIIAQAVPLVRQLTDLEITGFIATIGHLIETHGQAAAEPQIRALIRNLRDRLVE